MKKIYKTIQVLAALFFLQNAHSQDYWLNIESGTEFSLALKSDSTLWSWGNNSNGQLGIGNTLNQIIPVQIGTDSEWKNISAGAFHTLAIKNDGTLWAWGLNSVGQLGIGNLTQKTMCYSCGYACNPMCTGETGQASNNTNLYLNGLVIAKIQELREVEVEQLIMLEIQDQVEIQVNWYSQAVMLL